MGFAKIIRETKPELLVGTPLFLEGYVKQSQAGDFSSIKTAISSNASLNVGCSTIFLSRPFFEYNPERGLIQP